MPESRRWSILLYAVFLSAFLLAFFASFRTSLSWALADSASREISVRAVSSLSDSLSRAVIDPQSVTLPSAYFAFGPVGDDGSIKSVTAYSGIDYRFDIVSKGNATNFEAYAGTGSDAEFSVFDSSWNPVANAAVTVGTAVNVALPATATGSIVVKTLWGRSYVEIDRHGASFSYPDSSVRAYRIAGKSKDPAGIYRTSWP